MVIVSGEDAPDALCFLDASDTRKVDEVTFPEVTSNSFFASSTEYARNRQKRSNEVNSGLFIIKEELTSRFGPFWGSQALPEDGGISGVLGPGWPPFPGAGPNLGKGTGGKRGIERAPRTH